MTNLDTVWKSRDITLPTKVHRVKAMVFPVVMLDHKEGWALKNWCFWAAVLEKTLESPLDCKEIQPVHPKGNQSWLFIGRTDAEAETPVLWPPDVKNWLTGKDPDAERWCCESAALNMPANLEIWNDWRQEEKWTTEDEMARWYHWFDGHEFE